MLFLDQFLKSLVLIVGKVVPALALTASSESAIEEIVEVFLSSNVTSKVVVPGGDFRWIFMSFSGSTIGTNSVIEVFDELSEGEIRLFLVSGGSALPSLDPLSTVVLVKESESLTDPLSSSGGELSLSTEDRQLLFSIEIIDSSSFLIDPPLASEASEAAVSWSVVEGRVGTETET